VFDVSGGGDQGDWLAQRHGAQPVEGLSGWFLPKLATVAAGELDESGWVVPIPTA
jgi:hypothetical protein